MSSNKGREAFMNLYPFPPWTCFWCGTKIEFEEDLEIHHMDENSLNHDVANLFAIHYRCHLSWHAVTRRIRKIRLKNLQRAEKVFDRAL